MMRFPMSMAALIGACLLAAPACAAPVSAIKDVVLPAPFGDDAPIIKVQRVMNPVSDSTAQPPERRFGVQPSGQRPPAAAPAPPAGARQFTAPPRQAQPPFNRGGGPQYGGGYRDGGYRGDGYRGGYRGDGYRDGGYRDGYRGDRYRGDRRRDDGDDGAGVAAGVLGGLLLGAIIANESQRGAVNECARRYRSYDPRSQTFIGGDGRRYRCP